MMDTRLCPEEIVRLAFDATSAGELRQELVTRLVAATGAVGGTMGDPAHTAVSHDVSGVPLAAVQQAHTPFWRTDPHVSGFARLFTALKTRRAVADTSIWTAAERKRLPIRDLSLSLGIEYFMVARVSVGDSPSFLSLGGAKGRAFDRDDEAYLESLVPALSLVNAAFPTPTPPDNTLSLPHWLTDRQQEICRFVIHGYTNAEIAKACGISLHTVRNHLFRLFREFAVTTRTELASRLLFLGEDRSGARKLDR